ncbi:MAG: alanine racemase [Bacteroidales bacterium]|nr:alanine racemase [Bacteroidales bacterium]
MSKKCTTLKAFGRACAIGASITTTTYFDYMHPSITKPTFIVNEAVCRANIMRMAGKARDSGVAFRPHFKTHQSEAIGHWFKDYGVNSITVSSVSMARQFASAGWDDITIAFPVNIREIEMIRALAKEIRLNLLVDSVEVIAPLASQIDSTVGIFIEIDAGYRRSGMNYADQEKISLCIASLNKYKHLRFKGFLTHSGNTYNAQDRERIKNIFTRDAGILKSLKDNFAASNPDIIISMGDTPSCSLVDDLSIVDEIRPGNFVYYDLMQYYLGSCAFEDIAVCVACPVSGIYTDRNEFLIYGGASQLSKEFLKKDKLNIYGQVVHFNDNGWSTPVNDTYVISLSQEHGIIKSEPDFISRIRHGDILGIVPVHSCLTAKLLKDNIMILQHCSSH